jgi:hypothetical protein
MCWRAAYNVVGFRGTGNVSYQEALAAIFIEGWIFIALSLVRRSSFLPSPSFSGPIYIAKRGTHKHSCLGQPFCHNTE